jgi:hypothetical protein
LISAVVIDESSLFIGQRQYAWTSACYVLALESERLQQSIENAWGSVNPEMDRREQHNLRRSLDRGLRVLETYSASSPVVGKSPAARE